VDEWKVGDRVAIEAGVPCSKPACEPCRTGRYNGKSTLSFHSLLFILSSIPDTPILPKYQSRDLLITSSSLPRRRLLLHPSLPRHPHPLALAPRRLAAPSPALRLLRRRRPLRASRRRAGGDRPRQPPSGRPDLYRRRRPDRIGDVIECEGGGGGADRDQRYGEEQVGVREDACAGGEDGAGGEGTEREGDCAECEGGGGGADHVVFGVYGGGEQYPCGDLRKCLNVE
jgi:hypothetical protein